MWLSYIRQLLTIFISYTASMAMKPFPPTQRHPLRWTGLASTSSGSDALMINGMRLIRTLHGSESMNVKVRVIL